MSYVLPRLSRSVYTPRVVGFSLAVLITTFRLPVEMRQASTLGLLVTCAVYPHLAYWLHARLLGSKQWVCAGMLIDALLVGLLIVVNHYDRFTALAFIAFLVSSTAIIGGLRWVFAVSAVVILVVLVVSLIEPIPFAAFQWADAVVFVSTLGFFSYLSTEVFNTTRAVEFARRDANKEQAVLAQRQEFLGRFVAPNLSRRLQGSPMLNPTRRRRLTICFTDLTGFTRLMDTLPEHQVTARLNEYLNAMANIAIAHGGTLDKYMGDGVMVFYGDPKSEGHRNDAFASIKMALAMRQTLAALSKLWAQQGLPNGLKMRIGIHTGYCTVGIFGSQQRMDYTAIGGAVNIASRLEAAAQAGSILVSATTASLVHGLVSTGPYQELSLKGIRAPLQCTEILGLAKTGEVAGTDHKPPSAQLLR